MTVKTAPQGLLYVATESFATDLNDGTPILVHRDRTLVREGHELLDRFPGMFKIAEATFEVEQTTAAPGERRDR